MNTSSPAGSRLTFLGLPAGSVTAAIAAAGLLGINPGTADLLARYEPPSGQHRLGTAQGGERTQLGIPALQSNFPPKALA